MFKSSSDGSIFSVVPLHLLQSSFFSKSLTHWLVGARVPPNFFREFRLLGLMTPYTMSRICFLLITPPAALVSIAMSFTFYVKSSSKRFGLPWVYCCPITTVFIKFQRKPFHSWSSSNAICLYSNLPFHFFWDCLLTFRKMFDGLLYPLFNQESTLHLKYCC